MGDRYNGFFLNICSADAGDTEGKEGKDQTRGQDNFNERGFLYRPSELKHLPWFQCPLATKE
jgi:hypothetical protein